VSFAVAMRETVAAAASDLAGIGRTIRTAHATAAASTTEIVAAAEDEVSTAIADLFGAHAQNFQAMSTQATYPVRAGADFRRERLCQRRVRQRLSFARTARRDQNAQRSVDPTRRSPTPPPTTDPSTAPSFVLER
jgi:PE family